MSPSRKKADELRADSVDAARKRQAETLESIGRLAGGIAHDFNNLLTSILGYSELLDDQLRLRGNARSERSDLREIRTAAERARELTQRLLAFSRRLPASARLLNPQQLVTGTERLLRRFVSENIEITLKLTNEPGQVVADPTQLEQVLLSLAVNACDAMPNGGKLTIGADWREVGSEGPPHGELIGTTTVPSGSYIELCVTDTGRGMDADYVHRAFEPFVTTKENGPGDGLGLSAVYGLVTRAGGVVIVDSTPNVGTTVRVLLPRVQSSEGDDIAEPEHSGRGGGEIILLAEDDADVRTLNVRTLREAGYEVLAAEDGTAALEIAARPGLHIDLVITDVIMPGRNGWEVAEAILEQRPDALVLFVSGFAPASLTPLRLPERGFPFLAKPFTPSALLHRVRQLLDTAPTVGKNE
ncbi:MAG: ATP-binding protein [Gemmatimonadaceae bacterium]